MNKFSVKRLRSVTTIEAIYEVARIVIGLGLAFLVTLVCIYFIADDPVEAVEAFAFGPFTGAKRFGQLMSRFIPYVLMGVGMCFVYASGRFNLIGEGAFITAPFICTMIIFGLHDTTDYVWIGAWPRWAVIILFIIIGALVGGALAYIPAKLREKYNAHEMVISTMMNYMLLYLVQFVLKQWMKEPDSSYLASCKYPDNTILRPIVEKTLFHEGFYIVIVLLIVGILIYYRTPLGVKIRICGYNSDFAFCSGLGFSTAVTMAQVIGGAFAGAAGVIDAFGVYERYQYQILTNYGFDGLLVAVMAKKKPYLVPVSAFLLAYLKTAATVLNYSSNIPVEFVNMMYAVLVMCVAAEEFLGKSKRKSIFKFSAEQAKHKAEA